MSVDYINKLRKVAPLITSTHLYEGESGALRLAREIGWCLRDSSEREAKNSIKISYDVCIIGYNLRPPVDKKIWDDEVRRKYNALEDEE